jgi:hypothetical protein
MSDFDAALNEAAITAYRKSVVTMNSPRVALASFKQRLAIIILGNSRGLMKSEKNSNFSYKFGK